MASIREIKHAPERCVRVRLGDLEKWQIGGVWRGKGELIYRRYDTSVGDRPLQVARSFAADDARRRRGVTGIGSRSFAGSIQARRKEFGNTKVALWRRGQEIILGIL